MRRGFGGASLRPDPLYNRPMHATLLSRRVLRRVPRRGARPAAALSALLFGIAGLAALPSLAADPPLPAFSNDVVDQAGVIDAQSAAQIKALSRKLDEAGVAQLALVTVRDLGDRSIDEYAVELFKKWGLGHDKKRSDGVLLVIVPGQNHHHKTRIEVGYGLEGVIPDGKAGAILREQANPLLRQDRFGPAALAAMTALADLVSADAAAGGDTAPTKDSPRGGKGIGQGAPAPDEGRAAAGLAVVVLALGALLVSLLVAASRRSFPGTPHAFGGAAAIGLSIVAAVALAAGAAGFLALLVGVVLNAIAYFNIRSHRCPKCSQWMTIDTETTERPTYSGSGLQEIRAKCTSCSYRHTEERVLPRRVRSSGGGGGGWGGGGGGGGGGDSFSGGGGGESGGGGASSES